jgi:two-component system invasion response regulator UvrY
MYNHPAYALKMMKEGAMGYLCKSSPANEMFRALKEISCGGKYLCQEIKEMIASRVMNNEQEKNINVLSKRELEITGYIKEGFSSKEIAAKAGLSVKTVEVHRYNILKKLGLPNSAALVNFICMNSVDFF